MNCDTAPSCEWPVEVDPEKARNSAFRSQLTGGDFIQVVLDHVLNADLLRAQ